MCVTRLRPLRELTKDERDRPKDRVFHEAVSDNAGGDLPQGDRANVRFSCCDTQLKSSYRPTVFAEWFLTTWPEPSAWLASRTNYARTLAVMSMIGYVLGSAVTVATCPRLTSRLGDRHGENILFDGLTGDTVHVDLNCLFDKVSPDHPGQSCDLLRLQGKTFTIPERVPFRLTQNLIDALGVTRWEGVFRKAAEITLDLLRQNSESLMSVLEAFVHDPLVEWVKPVSSATLPVS